MAKRTAVLAFVLLQCGIGCGQLLGYDDLVARTEDASTADLGSDIGADVSDAAIGGVMWPLRPEGAATPSGKGKKLWIAVKHFYLGSYDHLGVKKVDAWREWGYDLDRVCTGVSQAADNSGVCKRADGADPAVLLDGDDCRDNNFGSQLIRKVLALVVADFEGRANESLRNGSGTWVLQLEDVDEGKDDTYAPGSFFLVGPLPDGEIAKFDGTDVRKALTDSVEGSDPSKPRVRFPNAYIKDDTWVSGDLAVLHLLFPVGRSALPLDFTPGVITMHLNDKRDAASDGIVAGGLTVDALTGFVKPLALEGGVCPGSGLYDSMIGQFKAYPDLVLGAKNLQDPSKPCDGISAGLGFDTTNIVPVTEVMPSVPPDTSKCSDAGVDAPSDGG